jgi:hypothetical protein
MKRAGKRQVASETPTNVTALPVRGHRIGRLVGVCETGWLVECSPGATPLAARTTLTLDASAMREAADSQREALVVFESESAERPIVVGLLAAPTPRGEPKAPASAPIHATLDGRQVTLEAQDEIVLRCGQASITLRRNGRVVIRGTYVETRAQGVNRIKGGSVQIN